MIYDFDVAVFRWLNLWAFWRPLVDALIIFRAVFLGWWMLAALCAFGVFTIPPLVNVFPSFRALRKKNWEMVGLALLAALVSRFGVTELIRFFYNRPRPFEVLSDAHQIVFRDGGGSFPSGHAAFSFAVAAVVSRYYPKTSILFFLAALNLSVARVQAGLHWPTDILGGATIGIIVGFLVVSFSRWYSKEKTGQPASATRW